MAEYRLEMRGVSKSFPGVKALDKINLKVRPGTVHALMGENGAGKSTLMKCLFGIYHMDEGEVYVDGKKVDINNPDEALHNGLAMVHQELQPVPERTIAENMYLGRFPTKKVGPLQVIDHKTMNEEAKKWLDNVKMPFDPKKRLGNLSISQMQSVEIAKAVSQEAKLIILDEPTSSLTDNEVEALFRIVRDLRDRGVSFVFISHKMAELRKISDDITIMRDGTYVGTWEMKNISDDDIVKNMVGRELTNIYPPLDNTPGDVLLEVDNFTSIHSNSFKNCSFKLRRGEILGFGGLVGAQRTELMEAIFGIRHTTSGEVKLNGKPLNIKSPKDAIRNGIGMITEDRRGSGILGCLSIADNISIASLDHYVEGGVKLNNGKIEKLVQDNIGKLSIKTPSSKTLIQSLSGGNQQKAIFGRWLERSPNIFMMDDPTRGIDVGAKYEIYELIINMAKQGKTIIVVSSEMPEILGITNRIGVMSNGHLAGIVNTKETDQEELLRLSAKYL